MDDFTTRTEELKGMVAEIAGDFQKETSIFKNL